MLDLIVLSSFGHVAHLNIAIFGQMHEKKKGIGLTPDIKLLGNERTYHSAALGAIFTHAAYLPETKEHR